MFEYQKPDKAKTLKELKQNVLVFGAWVALIRATPYVLDYFSEEKDELDLKL